MNNPQLAVQFLIQLAVILVACRVVGAIAARLGQPEVVAEMIAGIVLGPSLFGVVMPEWQQWLFPWDQTQQSRDTQSYLYPAAQLGLTLYMFVVGADFHVDIMKRHFKSAVAVSVAGVLAPLVMGAALAWVFFHYTDLFPKTTTLAAAMLFLGAAMSITALPVLARIIQSKKLSGTTVGTVSLAAGAINDAAAWCLLAIVLASLDNNWNHALMNIAAGVGYVAVTFGMIRPVLTRHATWFAKGDRLSDGGLVLALAFMALGAWFTDLIGLHAVFGAFVMGMAMPRGVVARDLIRHIQPLTVALLLPLFSAYSGLNTKFGLLNTGFLWLMCGAVLLASVVSKGWACWLAARATGIPNRQALSIGTLMNARGLMVLIIINIGLQRGVISEGLFAALVIMAMVTTLMASPLVDRLAGPRVPELECEIPTDPVKDAQTLI